MPEVDRSARIDDVSESNRSEIDHHDENCFSFAGATNDTTMRNTGAMPRRLFIEKGRADQIDDEAVLQQEEAKLICRIELQSNIRLLRMQLQELEMENMAPLTIAVPHNPVHAADDESQGACPVLPLPLSSVPITVPPISVPPISVPVSTIASSAAPVAPVHGQRVRLDEVKPLIGPFQGNYLYPVKRWISQFENAINSLNADPMDMLRIARQLFTGAAAVFIRNEVFYSWDALKEAMIKEFHVTLRPSEIYRALYNRHIQPGESVSQYILEMQSLASLGPCDKEEVIQCILRGLNDSSPALSVLSSAKTLDELKSQVPRYESMRTPTSMAVSNHHSSAVPRRPAQAMNTVQHQVHNRAPPPAMVPATNRPSAKMIPRDRVRCFNCSELGHFSSNCPAPRREQKNVCFHCKKDGHFIQDCPLKRTVAVVESANEVPFAHSAGTTKLSRMKTKMMWSTSFAR